MAELAGRIAVVTGGSRGIGRAIALRLAAEGAAVAVHYGREAAAAGSVVQAVRAGGGAAFAFGVDLALPAAVAGFWQAFDGARPQGFPAGPVDILVCNAGIGAGRKTIDAIGDAELDSVLQVNLKAPFALIRDGLDRLAERGRVIGISSMVTRAAYSDLPAYTASKAGLEALLVSLAPQLGRRGITVNAVQPGATDTDMNPLSALPERAAAVRGMVALGRIGTPADVADVVALLAGPRGGWITGQRIDASGGQRL